MACWEHFFAEDLLCAASWRMEAVEHAMTVAEGVSATKRSGSCRKRGAEARG